MEALIHDNHIQQKLWDKHAVKGWVIGTSDEHYHCWRLWIKRTWETRISGMVFFKHKYISNPTVTVTDAVFAAAQDMAADLQKNWTVTLAKKHSPPSPTCNSYLPRKQNRRKPPTNLPNTHPHKI